MKKRLCAGLLVLTMLFPLLTGWITPVLAAKGDPIAGVTGTEDNTKSAPYVQYATNEGAALKQLTFAQSKAWNLTIRSNEVTSGCQTYAVILRYDLFNANYNRDGDIGGIDASSYSSLRPGTSNPNYYRSENRTATRGEALDIFNQELYNFNNDRTYQVGESSTTYHMKYAAIIFDGATKLGAKLTDYTIVTFYLDREGWLQRDSYMLRYIANPYPAGNNTVGSIPTYQIEDWNTDATVNKNTIPTRQGYKFLGWDPTAQLMPSDANTAAANPATAKFPTGSPGPVAWTDIAAKFKEAKPAGYGTDAYEKNQDKFYNLYAVWQPNQVRFDYTNAADTLTVNGANVHVLTLDSPQVGVAYNKAISLDISATSTTDRNTAKAYTWIPASSGAQLTNAEGDVVATTRNITNDFSITVTPNGNTQWRISGTPGNHSDGKDVYTVLQVKDNANNTTDWIIIHFDEVKRRAQPIPAMDANTGLQSRIETRTVEPEEGGEAEEVQDGQIFGLYPTGAATMADNADNTTGYVNPTGNVNTGTNGVSGSKNTGTMTGYYKALGMAYEYRPAKIQRDGQMVTLVDAEGNVTEAGSEYFASQPNGGWREVPYPKDWYVAASQGLLADTMVKNAAKLLESTKVALTNMAQTPQNNATATVREAAAAWPDEYGYIEFEAETNLPVIHGLHADDIYELRFKKNATSEVSSGRQIVIGGAVASGGGDTVSGGMAVNLAGGKMEDDPNTADINEAEAYEQFVQDCHKLTEGDTIEIPSWKPTRENYTFQGWTLGERKDGELVLYNYKAPPTDDSKTEETDPGDEGSGDEGAGNQEPGDDDPPEAYEPVKVTMGDKPTALAAVWQASESGFASITFFDWDETTLIGSMVVSKEMSQVELTAAINEYTSSFMAREVDEDGKETLLDMSTWDDETAQAYTKYDARFPLTSHNGYTFGKWIDFTSEDFTVYGKAVDPMSAGNVMTIPTPDAPDYSKLSQESMVLKAAYVSNTAMDGLSTATQREYVVSNDTAPDQGYFGRFGDSSNYSLKFNIKRENANKEPVHRPRTSALRVVYKVGSTEVFSLVNLKNVDEQIVEVAAPETASSVSVFVIDTGGISNWADAAIRSSEFSVNSGRSGNDLGYIIYGTVNYINQALMDDPAAETITSFDITIFDNAGLVLPRTNAAGRRAAVTSIRAGQALKLAAEGTAYLSQSEMQTAIDSTGTRYK